MTSSEASDVATQALTPPTTTKAPAMNGSAAESEMMWDNSSEKCLDFCSLNACSLQQLTECVQDYIRPTPMEWLFICLHLVVFTVGVVGNFLVCFVVLRSRHMQTVTNLFIVNLAVADFIALIFASPPSVLQAVTETWYFGDVMCKITYFIQTQSIAVSVQTLCAIAVERYFAICKPLRTRITNRKVTLTILTIWLIATLVSLPTAIFVVLKYTFEHSPELSRYLTHCRFEMDKLEGPYHLMMVVTLYIAPMLTIGVFYAIISHHLWNVKVPGVSVRSVTRSGDDSRRGEYRSNSEAQLASRKKVAKMLIAIVLLFAACYLPQNLIFALRYTENLDFLMNWEGLPILFITAQWLVYFNSSFNPVIYNFMSAKFKKEFRRVFRSSRPERNNLLHESTYELGKMRLHQRTPLTQSSDLHNGTHV